VGKSCLLLRFADDTYTESYISTIGVDFVSQGRENGRMGREGWTALYSLIMLNVCIGASVPGFVPLPRFCARDACVVVRHFFRSSNHYLRMLSLPPYPLSSIQKIRTIELEGKTIKLQIVSRKEACGLGARGFGHCVCCVVE